MLLSDKRIVEELKNGNLVIEPFDERQLGTNSYDCRLGEWFFQGDMNVDVIHLDNPLDIRRYWGEPRKASDGKIAIRPGTTLLAHTQEVMRGEGPLSAGIRHTPTRLPGKVDRILLPSAKAEHLELGAGGFISNAGGDRQTPL